MIGRRSLAAGMIVLGTLAGCKFTSPPDLAHPGRADVQQKRALRYDPYPVPGIGGSMDGSRPREYDSPPSGPSESRWHEDPATNFQRWGTYGRD